MPLQSIASGSNGSPALGRWLSHPPPPPRREPARRAKARSEIAGAYTDSSGAFACRAATVASRVNAPEKRPSLGATIAEGRRAQPGGTAR